MKLGGNRLIALFGILASMFYPTNSNWAATIRDDVPDSSYQALAANLAYASVGMFVSNGPYTGSGVLIAPDWVLTTAHNLLLATSGTFTVGGTSYTANQLIMNPNWNNGSVFNGYDFGLAHLSSSVTAIPPATLYTGSSDMGQTGTYVGFGAGGTGLTGYQTPPDNLERAFQNVIDGSFNNPSVLLGSDFDNPHTTADNWWGDATPLPLEGCVAPGDSGGGMFITVDSQTYLAGIIAFVAATDGNANADYGDLSGSGRVSAFVPWIESTIPEPPASVLLAGAGLALFLTRRFRRSSKQPPVLCSRSTPEGTQPGVNERARHSCDRWP